MAHWKPAEDAIIRRYAPLRHTTSQMAETIKSELGINRTRDMVLSRSRRIGVQLLAADNRPLDTWKDPARSEKLRLLWKQGHPLTKIASILTASFDMTVSRGAVISKARSMGLTTEFRRKPNVAVHKVPKVTKPRPASAPLPPRPVKVIPAPVLADVSNARPWLTRARGECAYPIGEQGNIHSCCAPTAETYCPAHRQIMGGQRSPWVSTKGVSRKVAA